MPLPSGWPPRAPSGRRSVRVYIAGNTTANFADNAYLFSDVAGANTYTPMPYVAPGGERTTVNLGNNPLGGGRTDPAAPKTMIWCNTMKIINDGLQNLEFSFDGTLVHGVILPGETLEFRERMEAGISVRGPGGATAWRVFAW
jgi:hypothetical protein